MTDPDLTVRGHNGQLQLTTSHLHIKRSGIMSFITQGLTGDKQILLSEITAVQFKPANIITNGYLQVSFRGSDDCSGGLTAAVRNENAVVFTFFQQAVFEGFKRELDARVAAAHQSPSGAMPGSLHDLEKLAELHAKGIVTDEEFAAKKRQILGL